MPKFMTELMARNVMARSTYRSMAELMAYIATRKKRIFPFAICFLLPLLVSALPLFYSFPGVELSYPFAYHWAFLLSLASPLVFFVEPKKGAIRWVFLVFVSIQLIYMVIPHFSLQIEESKVAPQAAQLFGSPNKNHIQPYYTGPNRFLNVVVTSYKWLPFHRWQSWNGRIGTYSVHIYDQDGKEVQKRHSGEDMEQANSSSVFLMPGVSMEDQTTVLEDEYDIKESGEYKVQIESAGVRSNMLDISLDK